jgi:hypothetical protein
MDTHAWLRQINREFLAALSTLSDADREWLRAELIRETQEEKE